MKNNNSKLEILDKVAKLFLDDLLFYCFWGLIVFSLIHIPYRMISYKDILKYQEYREQSNINLNDISEISITGATSEETKMILSALEEIKYPITYKNYTIIVERKNKIPYNGSNSFDFVGLYHPTNNIIYITKDYLESLKNPYYLKSQPLSTVLAHEIAHSIDYNFLVEEDRNEIKEIRNYPMEDWRPLDCPWEYDPSEDFAEMFVYMTTDTYNNSKTGYKLPDSQQQEEIMEIINDKTLPGQEYFFKANNTTNFDNLIKLIFLTAWQVISHKLTVLVVIFIITMNLFINIFKDYNRQKIINNKP